MPSKLTVADVMAQISVAFGTSGARGRVADMTDQVCHAYTVGFLRYLTELDEFSSGQKVVLAGDLRPSTPRIIAACAGAIRDLGGEPVFLGMLPTPAMAAYLFARGLPSLMVTGSHIPADRNGIKFYRPHSEFSKADEQEMLRQPVAMSRVSKKAFLSSPLPPAIDATGEYIARYEQVFGHHLL